MSDLLDYHDALNALLETHQPLAGEEMVALAELDQRVLAHDVAVQYDVPAFDNSAMDGYAVSGNDCGQWQVVQRITAGDQALQALQHGQAARIFTGAPIPEGATAVVMQEKVLLDSERGIISLDAAQGGGPVADGLNIRRQAEELQRGTTLLEQGRRLTPAAIGLLSMQGASV